MYIGCDKTLDHFAASPNPKDGASEQRAALKTGCRADPCDSFPLLSYKESRAPAGQAGNGALRPEVGKSPDHP